MVKIDSGFIIIDTGFQARRRKLLKALDKNHCHQGDLKLIILTHGDFDHTGNCAHLKSIYGCPVAMHKDDAAMAELGDMFANRRQINKVMQSLMNKVFQIERFTPDILLEDGYSFHEFGFDATVIHLPGHSKGSIGILTSDQKFFSGDLFGDSKYPE